MDNRAADGKSPIDDFRAMPRKYFIGIDVGTESARACVVDDEGYLLGSASESIRQWHSQPGFFEQSTNDIWNSIATATRLVVAQTKIDPAAVQSIAFTATCSLVMLTHDTNEPVAFDGQSDHNVVLWMDQRAATETVTINETKHDGLRYFGGAISILMELPKVLWLKNHMAIDRFKNCRFFDLNDALTNIATGCQPIPCTARCEMPPLPISVDGTIKGCSKEFLETIGLGILAEEGFSRVGGVCRHGRYPPAGTSAGRLCATAAQDLGLSTDVVVGVGVIDSYAGWIGTVCGTVDAKYDMPTCSRLALVAGTSTCLVVAAEKPLFVKGIWGPYEDWVLPGLWMSQGGQTATGLLIEHVLRNHPAYSQALSLAQEANVSIFDYLNVQLKRIQEITNVRSISFIGRHYFYYGDLFGNRAPISDPRMTGSVVGITGDTTLENLALQYYGVMEFLALQTRHIISEMNGAGHSITSIFISGSQSRNPILVSLIASACGMPVVVPKYTNGAVCYGAALLGIKASTTNEAGESEGLWAVMSRLNQPGNVCEPELGSKDLLDVKYRVFLEQCERQRVFRQWVDEVTMPSIVSDTRS